MAVAIILRQIVINGDLIFPFDISSSILDDDNATAKTSASSNNNVNMTLPCDNDISKNIASANTTNTLEMYAYSL